MKSNLHKEQVDRSQSIKGFIVLPMQAMLNLNKIGIFHIMLEKHN